MKKLILIPLFILSLTSISFADCQPEYKAEIDVRIEKMEKLSRTGRYISGTVGVGLTVFFDVMGVVLVGPAGLLIGPQFGALGFLAVGTPFYIIHKVRKKKLEKLGTVLQFIEEVKGLDETPVLDETFKNLSKKLPGLTREKLKNEVFKLNESKALCDGTVSGRKRKKLVTPRKLNKYLRKVIFK